MLTMIEEEIEIEEMDLQLDKMRRLPRGSFKVKNGATKPENCKVKVSMYLDNDILQYFRQRAEQPNAAPYQTQINNELRKIMEADSLGQKTLDKSILEDTEFLKALKEKLETV
ncbi:MAG: BrnA antitoxin family protein [Pyrinomonadaceae bacterium]|nr:BrnA antitoxin family protein [Pyrinomonadaceae bacterium]